MLVDYNANTGDKENIATCGSSSSSSSLASSLSSLLFPKQSVTDMRVKRGCIDLLAIDVKNKTAAELAKENKHDDSLAIIEAALASSS